MELLRALLAGAAVYLDEAALSVAKWSAPGGVAGLLLERGGAAAVRDYPPQAPSDPAAAPEPDAVVLLLSTHLSRHPETIRRLLLSHPYQTCHIVVSLSEALQYNEISYDDSLVGVWTSSTAAVSPGAAADDLGGYFATVEARIYDWMVESSQRHGRSFDRDFVVSVQFQPLCFSLLTPDVFLIPAAASFFPPVSLGGLTTPGSTANSSPRGSQAIARPTTDDAKAREMACVITTLLSSLHVKDEIFALGPSSKQVARIIVDQSTSARRRASEKSAAVLIVDRTLDLVGPTMHSDNLLDQVWSTLSRRSASSYDANVSPKYFGSAGGQQEDNQQDASDRGEPHGPSLSLAHGCEDECAELVSALLRLGQKDGLVTIRRRLVDLIGKEIPSASVPKVLGRVTLPQLDSLMSHFVNQPAVWSKHAGLLTYFSAVIEHGSRWDELVSIEKVLGLSLAETMDPTFMVQQLRDVLFRIVQEKQQMRASNASLGDGGTSTLTAKDVLMLSLYAYSLLGDSIPMTPKNEAALQDALFRAMMAVSRRARLLTDTRDCALLAQSSSGANPRAIQGWVVRVFSQMRQVALSRSGMTQLRHLLVPGQAPPYDPLLVQLARTATQPPNRDSQSSPLGSPPASTSADSTDWTHVPYTAGSALGSVMSGFSRLLGSTTSATSSTHRTHPSQFDHVILVVLGGITFEEAGRRAVGSTNIATTETMMTHIFKSK
ncbi:hypothetical protein BC831DRAFT_497311 [Entophlyctis helioformis]|nr:hypothetical protein BC831DRAFT_497311 [Entophlyctis helioformis]